MAEAKKTVTKKAATKKTTKAAEKPVKEEIKLTDAPVEAVAAELVVKDVEPKPLAKAGKRSPKAVAEAEAKEEKETRKVTAKAAETGDKQPAKPAAKPARSRLERAGKKLRQAAEQVDKSKEYALSEALGLAVKISSTKFDSTVELHINLGVDPKQADQNIRDNLVLPAGSGKAVRVAVFADAAEAAAAKKAGADIAGADEFLQQLDKENFNFDILIATPAVMPKLGKYARLLGPKGLMPNPKSGTVTTDVSKAVSEAKAGRVEYRVDSAGIVHVGIGKASFGADKLAQNANAVFTSIRSAKPASLKGTYFRSAFVTTTMGPSIKLSIADLA